MPARIDRCATFGRRSRRSLSWDRLPAGYIAQPTSARPAADAGTLEPILSEAQTAEGSGPVEETGDGIGSRPRSGLGLMAGAGGGGAIGAGLLGLIGGLGAAWVTGFFTGGADLTGAFFGAACLARFATFARFLLAFFAGRALRRAALFLATARFAFAAGRFFAFAFFFAMFSLLLAVERPLVRE